jgi:hypothetical protein
MSPAGPANHHEDTLITIPRPRRLRPLTYGPGELPTDESIQESQIRIRLANTEGHRSKASYLIKRRYAWRGYQSSGLSESPANRITLAASDGEQTIATITVGVDSPGGLGVEELYPDEVKALRTTGRRLCEFTKLAVDNMVRSKAVLAALFHIAYIYGHRMRSCTDVVIEVNPRHVRFYRSMLGFELLGEERIDPRVNAPAMLLRLDLAYAEAAIARLGGHAELADRERLLYPLFFSELEEQGIEGRLRSME